MHSLILERAHVLQPSLFAKLCIKRDVMNCKITGNVWLASLDICSHTHIVHLQGVSTFTYMYNQTEGVILAAVRRLTAKLANLQQQHSAFERAEATRKKADLLTANLHRCRQGDKQVEVRTC